MGYPSLWGELRKEFSAELEDVAMDLDAILLDIENSCTTVEKRIRGNQLHFLLWAANKRLHEVVEKGESQITVEENMRWG